MNLKEARAQAGLSQSELSDSTGLSRRTIIRLERGETTPRPDTVVSLADALNMSYNETDNLFRS